MPARLMRRPASFYIHLQSRRLPTNGARERKAARPGPPVPPSPSEVKPNLRRQRSRSDVMGAAERRQEVVERIFIRDVDRRELQAYLVFVAMKNIVVTHSEVKQISRRDAWRIVIVILRPGCRDLEQGRPILRGRANTVETNRSSNRVRRARWRGANAVAFEPSLKLLVRAQAGDIHRCIVPARSVRTVPSRARRRARHQAAVIPPVESHPRSLLPRLI